MGVSDEISSLPFVDEHAVEAAAPAGPAWAALLAVAEGSFSGGATPAVARALGCRDVAAAGPRPLAVGSTIPGFHVAVADPPSAAAPAAELALAGRHRFSRYALVFRLEPAGEGRTRLRAETRAIFPGLAGAAYRAAVIGTRGHVLVTTRLLDAMKARAERTANRAEGASAA